MPNADVPPAGTGRPSLARRHPRVAFLLLVLLLGGIAHRPILQTLLGWGLQFAAAQMGFVFEAQISGNLLTRCSLKGLSLTPKPGGQTPLESLFVRQATFDYSPARLLFRGADRCLTSVAVEGVELRLSRFQRPVLQENLPAQPPERWLKALLGLPLFWTDQVRLSEVNITTADPQTGFALRGGMLTALPGVSGVLAVESLRLPGVRDPVAIGATTSFTNRRFILKGLRIAPALEISRLELDGSGRNRGVAKLQLEGLCGGGRLVAQLEAGPLTWLLHAEASQIKASELNDTLGKVTGPLPDLVSARVDLGGDPTRPKSWSGAVRLRSELPLSSGGSASFECGAALENGALELTSMEGRAPASYFAGSGRVQLPGTWAEFARVEGGAQLEFESNSLGEWMPLASASRIGGTLRGEAKAKLAKGGLQVDLQMGGDSVQAGSFRSAKCRLEASFAAPIQGLRNAENIAGNAVISLSHPEYSSGAVAVALDEGACALTLQGGTARFWNIILKDAANVLAGEISVPLVPSANPPSGSLQLNAKDLSLARMRVLGHPAGGSLEAVWVGTLEKGHPAGQFNVSGRALSWGAFSLGKFHAEASLKEGKMQLDEGALEWSNSESLRATGAVALSKGGAYDAKAEARLPNLERISPLLEQLGWAKSKVSGALEARWAGSGSLGSKSGAGEWSLRIKQAQWEQARVETFECSGHYVPGALTVAPLRLTTKATKFSAQIDWRPGALRCGQIALEQWGHPALAGEFILPLTYDQQGLHWVEDTQISGHLRADKLDLATLLSVNGAPSPLHGTVQFTLTLAGHPADPTATLRGSATGLRPAQTPNFGTSSLTIEGQYAQGTLTATATALTPLQAPILLSATLPVPMADLFSGKIAFQGLPLQANLQATNLNLGPLLHLWPGLRKISGSASVDLKLKGPVQSPAWHGSLKAECPLLHFASDRLPAVGGLTLAADFSEKELRLTRLKADLGGGALEIHGAASFGAPGNPTLDFTAKAHEVLVVRNSKLALRLNGDVFLKGPFKHAEISGAVSPTKSRVQRDIEVLPLNALRMEIPKETRTAGKPWFTFRKAPFSDWRFNVDMRTTPGDPVLLRGTRLRGSMDAEVRLEGTGAAPTLHGAYRSSDLIASLPFARIELSRGRIWYTRDHPFQPHVDFSAETEVRNHRIRLYLHGPANAPHISASSEPPEPEADLLTLIATGALPGDSSERSQALTNRAASVLFQEFSEKVLPSGERERFSALRRFSLDLGAVNNRTGQQETRLTYRFRDNLFMIGEVGTGGDFAGRVRYLLRFR
jgi:hypothetical protein